MTFVRNLDTPAVTIDVDIVDDILLTYNVVGAQKLERLMALTRRLKRLAVVLDNETVARGLSEAGVGHGTDVRFLVECDTGFGRNGVQTPEAAVELARAAMKLPCMQFEGILTYPNREPQTRDFFEAALSLFRQAGIPVPVVSGGGTPALSRAQAFPMMTEHRAGTYIYNDVMMVAVGAATWDDCAMRIRSTVVSRPTPTRAILDMGSKVLTSDLYMVTGYGHLLDCPEAAITQLSEEHAIVDLSACGERPSVGDVVTVIPNHCCVVSNMVDEVHAVRGDRVEAVWPVAARGAVR
jgi:D-serine deaminase-like pyridoxal phosphate-dependent protein